MIAEIPARYVKLFDFLVEAVFAEGGDGDGTVILEHETHTRVADWFQEYLFTRNINFLKRHPMEQGTLFTDERDENFVFTNDKEYKCRWDSVTIRY